MGEKWAAPFLVHSNQICCMLFSGCWSKTWRASRSQRTQRLPTLMSWWTHCQRNSSPVWSVSCLFLLLCDSSFWRGSLWFCHSLCVDSLSSCMPSFCPCNWNSYQQCIEGRGGSKLSSVALFMLQPAFHLFSALFEFDKYIFWNYHVHLSRFVQKIFFVTKLGMVGDNDGPVSFEKVGCYEYS